MPQSLKTSLYAYLRGRPDTWIHKEILSDYAKELGFMGENGTRRIRELVSENPAKIEMTLMDTKQHGKTAFYRYNSSPYERMNVAYRQTGQLKLI